MIKDRFFYPLAALIVAAIVVLALSFGERIDLSDREIWTNGYVMEGEDLARLTAQPGTQAVFIAATASEPAYARLTSTAARDSLPPGPGVFAPLGENYERAFATYDLRMTVTARASRQNPLPHFDLGYFTDGSGDSGWKRRELTPDWSEYSMGFTPGALSAKQGLDYFSVWPGEMSELLNMDVQKMRIEVLNPPT